MALSRPRGGDASRGHRPALGLRNVRPIARDSRGRGRRLLHRRCAGEATREVASRGVDELSRRRVSAAGVRRRFEPRRLGEPSRRQVHRQDPGALSLRRADGSRRRLLAGAADRAFTMGVAPQRFRKLVCRRGQRLVGGRLRATRTGVDRVREQDGHARCNRKGQLYGRDSGGTKGSVAYHPRRGRYRRQSPGGRHEHVHHRLPQRVLHRRQAVRRVLLLACRRIAADRRRCRAAGRPEGVRRACRRHHRAARMASRPPRAGWRLRARRRLGVGYRRPLHGHHDGGHRVRLQRHA